MQCGLCWKTCVPLLVVLLSSSEGGPIPAGPEAARIALRKQQQNLSKFADLPEYNEAHHATPPITIGPVTSVARVGNGTASFDIVCGNISVRVIFWTPTTIRITMLQDGATIVMPTSIVVSKPDPTVFVNATVFSDHYTFQASGRDAPVLVAAKNPLRLSVYSARGREIWAEEIGLSWNSTTTFQTLKLNDGVLNGNEEHFFGGGMQNGRFTHRGHRIRISTDFNWADGGNPSAVPFYISSSGYGAFRNTWSPGLYNFEANGPTVTGHNESHFDTFYFIGDFAEVLNQYTKVTGRPFMPPIYGLGLGDSDCYHNARHGNSTQVVIAVADMYLLHDIPGAWFLPNDGYGCGYGEGPRTFPMDFEDLDEVVRELHVRGFYTGLWSSTGLPNISREVGGSGARIFKTDVGWIGAGYKYAFDAVQEVADGIEHNSNDRRFIWTVEGWAGTHRNAVMWTGDDAGSWDYIRWQIPTYAGTGFSAMAHVSGDIDGIFGGGPKTYVRDLQFKCLMTVLMTMSGWAANPDKQPWTWGEPYTSINRQYLVLKMRLLPYMYSYSRLAHDTGMPPIRAMSLEFPQDRSLYINHTGSAMQFMSGDWLLVAPVYRDETVRTGIYLPDADTDWLDYWNGTRWQGNQTLNDYNAPLDTLPLIVRAGAIIPMWPPMLNFKMQFHTHLTFDIYPSGTTQFQLYEDDGISREYELPSKQYAYTLINCDASTFFYRQQAHQQDDIRITIGSVQGSYKNMPHFRSYNVRIHTSHSPNIVKLDGNILHEWQSEAALEYASSGWFFNPNLLLGLVIVKLPQLPRNISHEVVLSSEELYAHVGTSSCLKPPHDAKQLFLYNKSSGAIVHCTSRTAGSDKGSVSEHACVGQLCATAGMHLDRASGTPALEMQPCGKPLPEAQQWNFNESSGHITERHGSHRCIDLDRVDKNAELYACYGPPATINQRWHFDGNHRGHITSALDGSCMSIISAARSARDDINWLDDAHTEILI